MAKILNIPDTFNQGVYLSDRHLAEGRADQRAIRYAGRDITYAGLAAMVNRTGNAFKDLGVEIENRVMILLPDCPEFIYCYLGALKIGAVPVPVNTLASSPDYRHFLNNSRAKVLVISSSLFPKVENILAGLQYLRHILVVGETPPGALSYADRVGRASENLVPAETSPDDMAFWMYTSGTTGLPKAVVHLHHDLLFYLPSFCEEVLEVTEKDLILATSRMFFSYGRNSSLETPLMYGASVLLYPEWPAPREILQQIAGDRPTLLFSVPSFYAALLREVEKTGLSCDLSSLRLCISSGEALPGPLYQRWKAKFGLPIVEGLGSTDVGGLYLSNSSRQMKPGSSGRMLKNYQGRLVDAEEREVPAGQIGTLWLKNDGIASGYWNKHQRNKQVFRGEWFNTGDRFYRDAEGFFWYQGREDDMLKISGQWTSPLEIEDVLQVHPAVRECGVIGAPDESGLIKVNAFVVLNDGFAASPQLEKELAAFIHDRLAHFKTPQHVYFLPALPRTATGKLQRHALRQMRPDSLL